MIRGPSSLPFTLRRKNETFSGGGMTTMTETVHGLLRLDAERLVIQWRVARKTEHLGSEIRQDEELGDVREVSVPLAGLAGAAVRRHRLGWFGGARLEITAADLTTFREVAGQTGLKMAHPAKLVLRIHRRDRLAAEEFAADIALVLAERALGEPGAGEDLPSAGEGKGRLPGANPLLLLLLLSLACSLLYPEPSGAQMERTVGIHLGRTTSKQIWTNRASTTKVSGMTVGVNVEVPTNVSALSVRAGAEYVGRGSGFSDPSAEAEGLVGGKIKSHYLSFSVYGKLGGGFGPFSAYLVAGPTVEQLLETDCTPDLCPILSEDRPTILGVAAGPGLSVALGDRLRAEVDFLFSEGLTPAYRSTTSDARYRSFETLVRLSMPF
jgi:hypothetical protein